MMSDLHTVFCVFSFAMGACVASFLNVVVWRVPRGESIVRPPSHCPKCHAPIRWWQNLPILSWLALRGRCAVCRAPISPRYIFVETLGGALFLAAFLRYGAAGARGVPVMAAMWVWISLMIVGSFIDFDHQLLPDFVTVGGMALGVASSTAWWLFLRTLPPALHETAFWGMRFMHPLAPVCLHPAWSLGGLAFGFGLLWAIRWLGTKAFGREAMGMGDVLLMGAVGALFGPAAVLVTLMLSAVFGSVVGVALIAMSRARLGRFVAIPYGPYICLGCLAWMFWGPDLVRRYLALLGL